MHVPEGFAHLSAVNLRHFSSEKFLAQCAVFYVLFWLRETLCMYFAQPPGFSSA